MSGPLTGVSDRTIGEIQKRVEEKGKQTRVFGFLSAKGDNDAIAAWRQELVDVLRVFNVRSVGSV